MTTPRRRIVLCMGQHCNRGRQAAALYDRLYTALGDPRPAFMASGPVSWEIANCLDHCEHGPNLVVYPDGDWVHHLDLDALECVIARCLPPADDTPGGTR